LEELGIGANRAIFTLIHAILLKSLPVADPPQSRCTARNAYRETTSPCSACGPSRDGCWRPRTMSPERRPASLAA